ncbi:putative cytokinetic ring protein SteA [Nocardioides sp. SYSU DS0663]|uniref:putative cytokinetic ring protein SteA n=1 Tax=Nocardioides sp. SYSU DS0663 TaxID=3416445 RepID=UPI003F4C64F8
MRSRTPGAARVRAHAAQPGLSGTARVERRAEALLPRLRPGDIAVLDHPALDRSTAHRLVEVGVAAVVNASPLVSGRYPNLGPEVLERAGVPMVDSTGPGLLATLRDGEHVRIADGRLHVGDRVVGLGRPVDRAVLERDLVEARRGMTAQLETFLHNGAELLRREEELLLHGDALPATETPLAGRTAVVVVHGHDHEAELRTMRVYLREQQPVVVAVGRAADTVATRRRRPDIVVVDAAEPRDLPAAAVLRGARDVVVRAPRGTDGDGALQTLDRLGVRPLVVRTDVTAEDVALLLAGAGGAALVIGVGLHATLEEFLDRQRSGLASTYLTRLRLGERLIDAAAVPYLYSGRVRPHHLLTVMLAGLVALGAAVGVTPVGQEWADQLSQQLDQTLRGLLP